MNDKQLSNTGQNEYFRSVIEEDEISLIDLYRVLVSHRAKIFLITATIIVVAAAYAFSRPTVYEFSVNIEVGSIEIDGKKLDSIPNTQANLELIHIPNVLAKYRKEDAEQAGVGKVEVVIPKSSEVIQLKTQGTKEQEELYTQVLNDIVIALAAQHDKKLILIRKQMEDKYKIAKIDMLELISTAEMAKLKLDIEHKLLLSSKKLDEEKALLGVLAATQLRQQLESSLHAIARKKEEIRNMGVKIENIQSTHRSSEVRRSWQPVGTGKKVIVILGAVLGLMAGIFYAFLAEFLRKVRTEESRVVLNETDASSALPAASAEAQVESLPQTETSVKALQK